MSLSLHELLPNHIISTPAWKTLADTVEKFFDEQVWSPVDAISSLRNPYEIEKAFLVVFSRYLGLNINYKFNTDTFTDSFTERQVRRLLDAIYQYYEYCGKPKQLEKIMSYALSSPVKITPLWSEDYDTFVENLPPGAVTIYDGGTWFPTPHVYVEIEVEKLYFDDFNDDPPGKIINWETSDILNLFIELAPIHLVMEALIKKLRAEVDLYISCAGSLKISYPVVPPDPRLYISIANTPLRIRL